jgi:hypothetical protein
MQIDETSGRGAQINMTLTAAQAVSLSAHPGECAQLGN